jgi:hypothetical protein
MADGSRVCSRILCPVGFPARIGLEDFFGVESTFPKLGLVITTFDEHGLAERVDQSTYVHGNKWMRLLLAGVHRQRTQFDARPGGKPG